MSLGKLQAMLAAATNEVTVAAANINFDFTLVKYEAPKEYQPLGALLSTKRRHDAESGTAHITARRLGALFEGACPSTPNPLAAYGKRAPEIADMASNNNPTDYSKTMFAPYWGIDATSVWAAATSSKAALPVHLLNCMLAHVFEAPEAISIWVELVKKRRQEIAEKLEAGEAIPFSLAAAAVQQDIPRQQLAEWDSSARAWLRTADTMKKREQTQLQLVLKNINIPVNNKTAVFSGVIEAWQSAMKTMENLVTGMPQAVNDGAAIVGLSAWHLYPDMIVFGHRTVEVVMGDDLIGAGGVLSLGLSSSPNDSPGGVYWCLSLSSMRHYGHPVHSKRDLTPDPKRITFTQFKPATLGAVLGTWKIPVLETRDCVKLLVEICKIIKHGTFNTAGDIWVDTIMQPALTYIQARGEEQDIAERLVQLGRRRASQFISPSIAERPIFGLLRTATVLECLAGAQEQTSFIRRVASNIPQPANEPILLRALQGTKERPLFAHSNESNSSEGAGKLDHRQDHVSQFEWNRGISDRNNTSVRFDSKAEYDSEALVDKHGGWFRVKEAFMRGTGRRGTKIKPLSFGTGSGTGLFEPPQDKISYDDLLWCLQAKLFSPSSLKDYISRQQCHVYWTLMILTLASAVYDSLPDATVSVNSLSRPFLDTDFAIWFSKGSANLQETAARNALDSLELVTALAVVAYCEGCHKLKPHDLYNVMAISAEDSIYVPRKQPKAYELKRILGNVGKSGVVLLISPTAYLMTREVDLGRWQVADNKKFDGRLEDCFAGTSLHLTFTDYHVPIFTTETHGQQDAELSMQEAVISIRDSGAWVGDVNILDSLYLVSICPALQAPRCTHPEDSVPDKSLASVGTWDDVLDYPDGNVVVKATGNWAARLAIAALLVEHAKRPARKVVLCPPNICWKCLELESGSTVYVC